MHRQAADHQDGGEDGGPHLVEVSRGGRPDGVGRSEGEVGGEQPGEEHELGAEPHDHAHRQWVGQGGTLDRCPVDRHGGVRWGHETFLPRRHPGRAPGGPGGAGLGSTGAAAAAVTGRHGHRDGLRSARVERGRARCRGVRGRGASPGRPGTGMAGGALGSLRRSPRRLQRRHAVRPGGLRHGPVLGPHGPAPPAGDDRPRPVGRRPAGDPDPPGRFTSDPGDDAAGPAPPGRGLPDRADRGVRRLRVDAVAALLHAAVRPQHPERRGPPRPARALRRRRRAVLRRRAGHRPSPACGAAGHSGRPGLPGAAGARLPRHRPPGRDGDHRSRRPPRRSPTVAGRCPGRPAPGGRPPPVGGRDRRSGGGPRHRLVVDGHRRPRR